MTGLADLLGRLADLERRIREAVTARRTTDPAPDDPFRGLYLSDDAIDDLLHGPRQPYPSPPHGADLLPEAADLIPLDTELLLVALAPDVDSRFEQFYGYLNDDVTRRRATVGLALRLCGVPEASAAGRSRLHRGAPLAATGLLAVEEPDRPFLSRTLRVPDRVVAHLLGDDRPDPALTGVCDGTAAPVPDLPDADMLARALAGGAHLAYLRERPGGSGLALGVTALHRLAMPALAVDAGRLADAPDLARPLAREALLTRSGVVLGPLDGSTVGPLLDAFAAAPVPLVLYGTTGWDPRWTRRPPLRMDAAPVPAPVRAALWRAALDGRLAPGLDPAAVTAHFTLGPPQIRRAAEAAALAALGGDGTVTAPLLRHGARSQNAAGLERLARRIEPAVGWSDLVLPPPVLGQLRELAARARHRDRVLDTWRMRPGGGRGRGLTGLFAGDSGTGKTMSAEVIAASLGLDLYTVNLATVVDKYVGETEKNLERIFTEAAGVNGVLLFDEADAIFGKRSEVRDAHDRYANIESAYLLQRMETFDGIAILATNLRANLDEAFTRRLDVVVDFPLPDADLRRALWDRCLGPALPRSPDADLDFLAAAFDLAGGHIRSAAVTAAYLAAEANRPVGMADLVGAVAREYRKLGRLCLDREFGPYLALVA
ncbi:AAA family ATPase [Plantactinospora sp. GCM10030261]|uniref:ATP-binding protein n=1 Tax=Plantactinospora sp. GCM10030261 TaxID=3273420 RepID=UPI00360E5BC4